MKAVIYARYSSDNQREESIEGQIRECTEYAKYNDIEVVGHYIDRAYSAKTDKRPDFQRMIKDSAKKNFQLVIVWKLDRFARNRYDSAIYKAALKKNGVRVISVTEHITDDATGGLMESIFEGFAEYYSAELAEKTKRGMKENALKGKWNGGQIPFGYMVKDSYLAIDETLAPIVRKLFEMCADGITVKDIHKYVQEKGILRPNGKKITYSSLRYLLSNRVYIGEYRHSGIIHENVVPAIVDKEVYDRAQEQISRTAHAPARHKAEDDYLLTLKLYCGHCGALMTAYAGTSMTGTLYRYYACNRARKKLCDKKRVNKQKIEDFVIYKIVELLKDGELLDRLAELLYSLQYKESTILPRLEEELCQKEKEIERIVDAIQKGISSDALMKRLAMLEEQKKVVEDSIEEEKEKSPVFTKDQFCMALYNFRKIDVNTQEGKRKLIDTFVNSIFLYDDRLKIVFNGGAKNEEISLSELESSYSIQAGQPCWQYKKAVNSRKASIYAKYSLFLPKIA